MIPMMYIVDRSGEVAIVMLIAAIINGITCLILVPEYGTLGAAVSSGGVLILMKLTLVVRLYQTEGIVCLPSNAVRKYLPGVKW